MAVAGKGDHLWQKYREGRKRGAGGGGALDVGG